MTRAIPLPTDVRRDVSASCGTTTPSWRQVFPIWQRTRLDWTAWRLRRHAADVPPWFCPRCGIDLLANPFTRLTLTGITPLPTLAPKVQCDCGHTTTFSRDGLAVMASLR